MVTPNHFTFNLHTQARSKSMDPSPSNTPSLPLEEHLTKLQNLLRGNQDELIDRERVAQPETASERADVDKLWIAEEIKKCDELFEQLDKMTKEDRDANRQVGSQNTGVD